MIEAEIPLAVGRNCVVTPTVRNFACRKRLCFRRRWARFPILMILRQVNTKTVERWSMNTIRSSARQKGLVFVMQVQNQNRYNDYFSYHQLIFRLCIFICHLQKEKHFKSAPRTSNNIHGWACPPKSPHLLAGPRAHVLADSHGQEMNYNNEINWLY